MSDDQLHAELLMSRIVDGEASVEDRHEFEMLAAASPQLWRVLAQRQQDMAELAARVGRELNAADLLELPEDSRSSSKWRIASPWRTAAVIGWAAAIALAAFWTVTYFSQGDPAGGPAALPARSDPREAIPSAMPQSYDQHFAAYLQAPFVVGEFPATLLRIEPTADGQFAMHILRRIEEVIYFNSTENLPVNQDGDLTRPPAQLRGEASAQPTQSSSG